MRLFITGANSFVGRQLQSLCESENVAFTGIDVCGPFSAEITQLDVRSKSLVDVIPPGATVVHLAAVSRHEDCEADPPGAMSVNIGGTVNVGLAAIQAQASRLIFASSEWVYGKTPSSSELRESSVPAWQDLNSLYAFSKATGEVILQQLSKWIPVTTLRFGIVYGLRMDGWSAFEAVVSNTLNGAVTVGSLETSRRSIHVDDVCAGILAAAASELAQGQVWNLAGPELVSLGKIVETTNMIAAQSVQPVELDPGNPSIRNPIPDLILKETTWRPTWNTVRGVGEIIEFLSSRNPSG